jgi:hypothetical protein
MAAHGVNLALAYGGQEALFADVYASLGLNESELGAFFNGPAFLSWSRGQGQAGVGGPLPGWWYGAQLSLNQRVVAGMQARGIVPVLPVFQGNVPLALRALRPAANISALGWLDVFDPLFNEIQQDAAVPVARFKEVVFLAEFDVIVYLAVAHEFAGVVL